MLPAQAWAAAPETARMLEALEVDGGRTRLVGGVVRDALLGLNASDVDLATMFEPAEVARRLGAAGVRTIPTGIDHGTLTAIADGRPFEVTTLRRDVSTDGRRAEVAFTDRWEEDAARRDFTMNALYASPRGGLVHDFFGGVEDLGAGRVRFIGDPLTRIAEDHLRILRFFRFHARFGSGPPDADGLEACTARARDLMALSRERVRDELMRLLCAPRAAPTLALMAERGVLQIVLPDLAGLDALVALIGLEAALGLGCSPIRRLAALLPPDAGLLDAVAHRLRLSTAERRRLVQTAARLDGPPADPRALAYWRGADGAVDAMLLAGLDPRGLSGWERPALPVKGGDLIAAGLPAGPEVARRLKALEAAWVESGFALSRAALLAMGAR